MSTDCKDRQCAKEDFETVVTGPMYVRRWFCNAILLTNRETREIADSQRIGAGCHTMEQSVRQKVDEARKVILHVTGSFVMTEAKPVNANLAYSVAGNLTDSKSTSGGILCTLGDHTCVSN